MRQTRRVNSQQTQGFTLIEVLISITILGFLMMGIIAFTQSTQDVSERVVREDNELLLIESAMSRFEWDFSQIYSPLYFSHAMKPEGMSEEEGESYNQLIDAYQGNSRFSLLSYDGIPIPLFKNPSPSTIVFLTSSNRRKRVNTKQSHYSWVKYSLISESSAPPGREDHKEKAKIESPRVLVRHVETHNIYSPQDIDWERIKPQVLLRKIKNLTFEFWNARSSKWTDNLELIKNGFHKITAIRLIIDYYDFDNIPTKSVRIFRPLFPDFKPEDMYKFLNKKPQTTSKPQVEKP